jgi:hypothetical protein
MSGKKWIIVVAFAIIGMNLSANERGFMFKSLFGGGGGTAVFDGIGGYGIGGVGEFAVLFYNRGLQVSSHIVGRGDSVTTDTGINYGTGSILGKLSFGGFFFIINFRGYSFVEGGIGFGGGNGTTTSNIIFGGGGGIDLFFHQSGSVYLELGYLQHYLDNILIGGVSISIGTRGWLFNR